MWHKVFTLVSGVLFVVILILSASALFFSPEPVGLIGGSLAAAVAGAHLWVLRLDPNRARAANRARVGRAVESGLVVVDTPGAGEDVPPPIRPAAQPWAVAAVVAAVPLFVWPAAAPTVLGWPRNAHPVGTVLAGPGDTIRIHFTRVPVQSLRASWEGKDATATLLDGPAGPITAKPESDSRVQRSWFPGNDKIDISAGDDARTPAPYVTVTLPDDPALAGQTVRVQAKMSISYPVRDGESHFRFRDAALEEVATVRVGPRGLRTMFNDVPLLGAVLGVGGGVALMLLAHRPARYARRPAPPAEAGGNMEE
jgi:hypothetical protein